MTDEELKKAKRAKEIVELCEKILEPLYDDEYYSVSLVFKNKISSDRSKECWLCKGNTASGWVLELLKANFTATKQYYKQELEKITTNKKKQEIQEMETDVEWCLCGSAYGEKVNVDTDSLTYLLRAKGYRKADEVRKETAKELLDNLLDCIQKMPILDEHQKHFLKGVAMGMRIKYGVEKNKDNG